MTIKKYLCVTTCYWNNIYFKADQEYELDSEMNPPQHFVAIESGKKEALRGMLEKYKKELAELEADKTPHPATVKKIGQLKKKIAELEKVE